MPKLKTRKSVAKRFRMTATGKIKRSRAYRGHILAKKTTKRKRRLRAPDFVSKADIGSVKKLLPYG